MNVNPALNKKKGTLIIFCVFLILLFFFARFSNWNFDEVWTYYGIEDNSPWDIITYSKFKYANNHLFNSLYFKLLQAGSVKNIVVYRILGIGGSCLFFLASIKILDLLKINRLFVIVLLVAPYFHILFLGRGYSMSMACFSISLYCLLKYAMGDRKTKYEYGVVVFGGLASLSLFSFLYGYFAMLAVLGYFMLRHLKSIHTLIFGIIVLAVSLYVYRSGKIVNDYDPYINGSKSLLKGGTISSIISDFSYFNWLSNIRLYYALKVLVVFSLLVPLFYIRKVPIDHNPIKLQKVILFVIIGVSLVVMIIAHVFAGALYPLYRGVFYLEYVFLLLLLISTATFSKRLVFYLPVFIICLFSLAYIVYFALDLEKPNSHDIIFMTGNNPLYILRISPAIQVTNDFEGLHKTNIYQNEKPAPIIKAINSDSGSRRYLLCPFGERDLVTSLKLTKICDCREERILYIVGRE